MASHLHDNLAVHPDLLMADAAYTLQTGRKGFSHRASARCGDRDEAFRVLETQPADRFITGQVTSENHSIAFLFPGQGAQHIDMARGLYQAEPVFRREFDRCLDLLKPYLDFDLRAL